LEGDAHAGPWHRQLSLLALADIEWMRSRGMPGLRFGSFAENLVIGGLEWERLGLGSRLRIGEVAEIRITQIGKECHTACAIRTHVGDCIMPTRGLFAEVLRGGEIAAGDTVDVLEFVPRQEPAG
jgi:MOSC domain-containing protein YiiM